GLCAGLVQRGPLRPEKHVPPATSQRGYASITIREGGQVVLADAPLMGELVVRSGSSQPYTLTADVYAGTTLCGSTSASVTVTRTHSLSAAAPDRIFHPGQQIPVTVRVSCPAPSGGLEVILTSADPELL